MIRLIRNLPVFDLSIDSVFEIDNVYWFDEQYPPTCRAVVDHARRMLQADIERPVILSETGLVMDGMHRICAALMAGRTTIKAVQFEKDPEPDSSVILTKNKSKATS